MLITFGENMTVEAWIHEDDRALDIDAEGRAEDQSELMRAVPEWMPSDTRRSQLLQHFHDYLWHD